MKHRQKLGSVAQTQLNLGHTDQVRQTGEKAMKCGHTLKVASRKLAAAVTLAVSLLPMATAHASNDYVDTTLRTDLSYIQNAQAFGSYVAAVGQPTGGGFNLTDFTYGWIGVFPQVQNTGYLIQMGVMTDINGVRWAAESLYGHLTCLSGHFFQFPNSPAQACFGDYNTSPKLSEWDLPAIYYAGGVWYLRLQTPGGTIYAGTVSGMQTNILSAQVDGEEGYTDQNDPYITMNFYQYHPQYWTGSAWTDWPASPSRGGPPPQPGQSINYFDTNPLSECPSHYGGVLNYSGDPRYWYTGSGGTTCASVNSPITQF